MKTEIEMKFDTKEVQKIYSELKKENEELKFKLSEISKRFEPQVFTDLLNEVEQNYNNKQNVKKAKFIIEQLMNMKNYSADEQIEVIKKAKAFLH